MCLLKVIEFYKYSVLIKYRLTRITWKMQCEGSVFFKTSEIAYFLFLCEIQTRMQPKIEDPYKTVSRSNRSFG